LRTNLKKPQRGRIFLMKLLYLTPLALIPFLFSGNKEKYIYGKAADFKTWESKTTNEITKLHPLIRNKVKYFIADCRKNGYKVRIYSTLRTWTEQKKLYAQGRTAPGGIVTNAKPGRSYHNYGLAFDCCIIEGSKCNFALNSKVVSLAKKYGFSWGGDWTGFQDKPHFQYGVKSINQLEALYKAKKKQADGYVSLNGISGLGAVNKKEDPFKKAYDWALENLVNKTFEHPEIPNKLIIFTKEGIKHAIYSNKIKRNAFLTHSLPAVFLNAKLYKEEINQKDKNLKNKKIYKLKNIWTFREKEYLVLFILKELTEGVLYYDHSVVKLKKP